MQLVAGRIARVHGLRGEVLVEVRTDDPDERFATGAVLVTEPADKGPLTVASRRWHSGRLLLKFVEAPDRTAAESLPGVRLVVDVLDSSGHDDEYYDHELVGLAAVDPSGAAIGVVAEVLHHTGQELLLVRRRPREDVLVPFVAAIVTAVDLVAGQVVIDPPVGLLDDDDAGADTDRAGAERADADRGDADRRDTDRAGADRPDADRPDADRPDADRAGADELDADRAQAH